MIDKKTIELIKQEGNSRVFVYKGYPCEILRFPSGHQLIHLCGYVGVSNTNKLFENKEKSLELNVHGGVTYTARGLRRRDKQFWWIGFDCAHAGDMCMNVPSSNYSYGTYRTMEYVEEQLKQLVDQIAEYE